MPVSVEQIRVGTVLRHATGDRRVTKINSGLATYELADGEGNVRFSNRAPIERLAHHATSILSQPDPAPPDREAKVAALVEAATRVLIVTDTSPPIALIANLSSAVAGLRAALALAAARPPTLE